MHIFQGKKIVGTVMINNVEYPPAWWDQISAEDMAALGVSYAEDPVRPDDRVYVVTENEDGSYSTTARPLADVQAAVCAQVNALAVAKRAGVVGDVSPYEAASWPIKRAEALAYQTSSNSADAPNLSAEATARGITLDALVSKVLAKAVTLSALEAGIAGTNGKHNDAISALTAVADVLSYDITVGWPV